MPMGFETGPQMFLEERHRPLCSPTKALSSPGVTSLQNHHHLQRVALRPRPWPSGHQAGGPPCYPHLPAHPIPEISLPLSSFPLCGHCLASGLVLPGLHGTSSVITSPLPPLQLTPLLTTTAKGLFLKNTLNNGISPLLHDLCWLPWAPEISTSFLTAVVNLPVIGICCFGFQPLSLLLGNLFSVFLGDTGEGS